MKREYVPNKTQKKLAHLAIDEGADLIIGHHPHVLQGIEKYKGKSLFVTRENAVELEEDEYYIGDLIGMEVYTDDSEERFGVLKDVMETGANDVYCVKTPEGKELLLPAIHDCILDVDLDKEEMLVHVLPGLLDL